MRLRFIAVFLVVLTPTPSLAAINTIVADVYSYNSNDYLRVAIQPEISADILMGEPLIACRAKWSIKSAHIDGENYPLSFFPPEAQKDINLFSLQLIFQIDSPAGFNAIACDPGHLEAPGSNKWSFTVTGSPSWEKLIRKDIKNTYTNSLQSQFNLRSIRSPQYLDADSAKTTYRQSIMEASPLTGTWVRTAAIEKGEVNLWPLRNIVLKKRLADSEKVTTKPNAAEKVVTVEDIDSLFSDAAFDTQLKAISKSVDDQAALTSMRDDIKNGEEQSKSKSYALFREYLRVKRVSKACSEQTPENLQALLAQTQECQKKWQGLEPFDVHGRYGYKLNGEVVIEAQYSDATSFKNGYALVVKNDRLLSITPSGDEHNQRYDISLESGYFSTLGLILAKEDELYGYINSKGETIIDFQYSAAESFDDLDRAIVKKNRGAQLIDENGTVLARSPINFELKDGHYISSETYDFERGNCSEDDVISGSTQAYTADGQPIGEEKYYSYRQRHICLLRSN
ncbi:Uncharacterised protein [Zhongshania aliphaticivorans]|uniref:WG repeat-containing protein n=1 Tax=Zhongshania aliphaticivorans TaxID=1470434 RepID=A0A5S9NS52_9GAMM|nr:WG repeat-containing protein [Zhongshania aliphaticivorans]CAA0093374.1 Uncharacterised protein [Zhongshania aliphaticivorans]CAA0111229.1 Uncharacterised protein [Zhongshania aliphaticivorans]